MRMLFLAALTVALLSGCAAPISQQLDQLNASVACCTEPAQLKPAGTLGTEIAGALLAQTPLVIMNGKRSPALRFLVPAELAGRQLQVRVAPMDAGLYRGALAFAPVAIAFLTADGTPIAAASDSDLEAGPAQSFAYSYALWRRVTVPAGAASAVFYSDPARYGMEQTFSYRFGGMMPAGGILLSQSANAKAVYKVFGEFSAKTL